MITCLEYRYGCYKVKTRIITTGDSHALIMKHLEMKTTFSIIVTPLMSYGSPRVDSIVSQVRARSQSRLLLFSSLDSYIDSTPGPVRIHFLI